MAKVIKISFLVLILAIAVLLTINRMGNGCGKDSLQENEISEECNPGMKIVSLSPNITEILFAIGLGENVVGVTSYCDFPPEANEKNIIGTITQPNTETILTLKPDLILTTASSLHQNFCDKFQKLGLKSIALEVEQLEDIYKAILSISKECGIEDRGKELVYSIKCDMEAVRENCKNTKRPSVLVVIQREPLMAVGNGTYINELLDIAGGVNVVRHGYAQYPQINSESLIMLNPDIIIETACEGRINNDLLESTRDYYKKWANIKAVKNHSVYLINADILSRPGPRVVWAVEKLAEIINE